jgi:hypothetical protein
MHEEQFHELFRSLNAVEPSAGFADRTMKAVKASALPPGRVPLRHPLGSVAAWAALIAGGIVLAWALVLPLLGTEIARIVSRGIGLGAWLAQVGATSVAVLDLLVVPSTTVMRAVVTREGIVGLLLVSAVGAFSMSALYRLLTTEGSGGVSRWQEL